jgi:hypothetical protein
LDSFEQRIPGHKKSPTPGIIPEGEKFAIIMNLYYTEGIIKGGIIMKSILCTAFNGKIRFLIAALAGALILAGCGTPLQEWSRDLFHSPPGGNKLFVPVTDITGVPITGKVEIAVDLSGAIVAPPNATNQTIRWSIKPDGEMGAAIVDGPGLTAAAGGIVTITATISNGLTPTTDYSKDFTITIDDPGFWVAVGQVGKLATSANGGVTWTVNPAVATIFNDSSDRNILCVAYGGGTWVAAGDFGKLITSTDGGQNWVLNTSARTAVGGDAYFWSVAYGDGRWIAAGDYGNSITSTNGGASWAANTGLNTVFEGKTVFSVAYDGTGRWLAAGQGGRIATSTDGLTWTRTTLGARTYRSVAYGKGTWLIGMLINDTPSNDIRTVSVNPDGSVQDHGMSTRGASSEPVRSIAYGGGRWVLDNASGIMTVPAGSSSWTTTTVGTASISAIAYGSGRYLCGDSSGKVAISTDGTLTWTSATVFETGTYRKILALARAD